MIFAKGPAPVPAEQAAFELGRGLISAQPKPHAPFAVAEFIAHNSMLPFGSLNHAQDHGINGQTACPLSGGERTYGRHSEIDAIDLRLP